MNSLRTGIAFTSFVVPADSSAQSLNVIGSEFPRGVHLAMVQQLSPAGNTSFVNEGTSIVELPPGTNSASVAPVITTNVGSGIVYTCGATVNAVAGVCNFLNTTIAGLYAGTFTHANASIYITFGTTGLGQSRTSIGVINYTAFRNALIAVQADANDATATTSQSLTSKLRVPSSSPGAHEKIKKY